jgi:hypothetical protein
VKGGINAEQIHFKEIATLLAVIAPIGCDVLKVYLAQGGHERNFPEYSVKP